MFVFIFISLFFRPYDTVFFQNIREIQKKKKKSVKIFWNRIFMVCINQMASNPCVIKLCYKKSIFKKPFINFNHINFRAVLSTLKRTLLHFEILIKLLYFQPEKIKRKFYIYVYFLFYLQLTCKSSNDLFHIPPPLFFWPTYFFNYFLNI